MSALYDAALEFDPLTLSADLSIADGDLAPERDLTSAILLSLFTDARAEASDPLPQGEPNRRGYWADAYAEVSGDRFGSKLWLLEREKSLVVVAAKAKQYADEALAWLVADGIAQKVAVTAELLPLRPTDGVRPVLALSVQVHKPPDRLITFRFRYVWGVA